MRPILEDTTRFTIVGEIQHRLSESDEVGFKGYRLTEKSEPSSDSPGSESILRLDFSVASQAQNLHGDVLIRDMKGNPFKCKFQVIDDNAQDQSRRHLEAQMTDIRRQIDEKEKEIDEELNLKLRGREAEYRCRRQACSAGLPDLEHKLAKK